MKKGIKKFIPLIIVLVFIGLFILLGLLSKENPAKAESEEINEWLIDTKKDEFVVTVLGQTTCSHCLNYKPVINEVQSEYNFNLKWIEIDTLSSVDRNIVENTYKLIDFEGTPHTFITKNGKLIKELSGEVTKTRLISALKVAGVIENN